MVVIGQTISVNECKCLITKLSGPDDWRGECGLQKALGHDRNGIPWETLEGVPSTPRWSGNEDALSVCVRGTA